MSDRARTLAALAAALLIVPGCAGPRVKLEMSREVTLVPPTIQSLTLSPSGRISTYERPRVIEVTLKGDPELQATFDLKGRAAGNQMQEVEPGVYVGSFEVKRGESGMVEVIGHLMHPPTGARQNYRVDGELVLDNAGPATAVTCTREMAEAFEEQLEGLTVHFGFDRHELEPVETRLLDSGKSILASNPLCPIRIHGHADEVGTPEYNEKLSIKRALEVRNYLEAALGVRRDRIELYFHGETRPIDSSGTPEAQALNRRVELHALYRQ